MKLDCRASTGQESCVACSEKRVCTSLPPSPSLRIGQSFSCSPAGSCCGHCSCELSPALLPRLAAPAAGLDGKLGKSRGLAALGTGAAACSAWSSKTP